MFLPGLVRVKLQNFLCQQHPQTRIVRNVPDAPSGRRKSTAQTVPFSRVLPQDFNMNTVILREVATRIAGNVSTRSSPAFQALSARPKAAMDEETL